MPNSSRRFPDALQDWIFWIFVRSDFRLFAQELLEIGNGHIDAVPSNGRRSTQDEEGDVCPISGRSAIFNQAIH